MDTVSRIAPAALPLTAPLDAAMARLVPPGMVPPQLFLAVARNEGLFRFLVDSRLIGPTGLLDRKVLEPALREAIVLRTCVATGNDYEFNLHVQTISERMGLAWAQIEDVRQPRPVPALWSARQLAALRLVDALVGRQGVDDATYTACREVFEEDELLEITQLAGLYVGVAMLVELVRPAFDRYRFAEPVRTRPA